mmetsp:Transcript_45133/g.69098  ORF Transcript_45133/g.69098 Transcript_45133/m.69098 type:complete len:90 (-) Transcript_45133:113-382(-)
MDELLFPILAWLPATADSTHLVPELCSSNIRERRFRNGQISLLALLCFDRQNIKDIVPGCKRKLIEVPTHIFPTACQTTERRQDDTAQS